MESPMSWQFSSASSGCSSANGEQVAAANVVEMLSGAVPEGYARAYEPIEFVFPDDHGPHDDYQTEWWYYTGNLTGAGGDEYGFQLTFFRSAIEPDMPAPTFERGCVDPIEALENPDYLDDPDYLGPEWTPGTEWEPVAAIPTPEDWQAYRDWLSDAWEAIWEARDGQPVVLRHEGAHSV